MTQDSKLYGVRLDFKGHFYSALMVQNPIKKTETNKALLFRNTLLHWVILSFIYMNMLCRFCESIQRALSRCHKNSQNVLANVKRFWFFFLSTLCTQTGRVLFVRHISNARAIQAVLRNTLHKGTLPSS